MAWISQYQKWLSEAESMNNAQMVADHFAGSDWSREAIAALVGNMRHESSINPDMYEYGYDWSSDRGYGLVQWTPRSKYWNWATARGLEPRSGDSQLSRIDYEVENNIQWIPRSDYGGATFKQFRQNSGKWSVDYLTEMFTWSYERPNSAAGWESMPARKAFARKAFAELDWSGTGGGGGKPFFPSRTPEFITSEYGWRDHPDGTYSFHYGMDIGGSGTTHPIHATQTGVVYFAGWTDWGGWSVRIQHTADPYYSMYLHMESPPSVKVGDTVSKGQQIGMMGNTGNSFGIHLHFEIMIRPDGFSTQDGTIDPRIYLAMDFGGGDGPDPPKKIQEDLIVLLLSNALHGW